MRTRLTLAALIAAAVLIAADEPNFSTWDSNGGGADHSQYSSLKQINKNNVKQLQVAWMYESGNNPTFNPVVVDGTMYVGTQNAIVALDAAAKALPMASRCLRLLRHRNMSSRLTTLPTIS